MAASPTVVILTYNEELNLPDALKSVDGWATEIFLVDSFSTDRTLEIARSYGVEVYQHPFEHWATQRNWALDNLPIRTPWVLFLDADERVSQELADEITQVLPETSQEIAGFYIGRRFIFMGRWLKRGGLWPNYILRLVRKRRTRVERIGAWEYFRVDGNTKKLQSPLLHQDRRGLTYWIDKHNRYSSQEAQAIVQGEVFTAVDESSGTLERTRQLHLRQKVWERMPLLVRPIALFLYRYLLQLGFLEGIVGLIYFFLHDFWYPFLVAAKVRELQAQQPLASAQEES